MDLSDSTWWWLVAGVLAAAELGTGTLYMLMLAMGCAAGALAAHAQQGVFVQAIVAAAVGGGAVLAWHRVRARAPAPVPPQANRDINLDIGELLQVDGWNADGTARVPYRGSAWNVRFIGEGPAMPGPHVIAEVRHNELAVRRA